eukprot:scaffold2261_cov405-Prasinococcus_capsulatus_cf.AAC.10
MRARLLGLLQKRYRGSTLASAARRKAQRQPGTIPFEWQARPRLGQSACGPRAHGQTSVLFQRGRVHDALCTRDRHAPPPLVLARPPARQLRPTWSTTSDHCTFVALPKPRSLAGQRLARAVPGLVQTTVWCTCHVTGRHTCAGGEHHMFSPSTSC